jgi:alpha-2-macroglobulin-like protein
MLDRTVKWMLQQKDDQGGWRQSSGRWGARAEIRNAYINWALTEAGYSDSIEAEIESSYQFAKTSDDPYLMALVANVLLEVGDQRGEFLVEKLLKMQQPDGLWIGKEYSVMNSQGFNLNLETSALAVMALLDSDQAGADKAVELAIMAISKNKTEYGFGSTQATILCIKALLDYADKQTVIANEGAIALYINDQLIQQLHYNTSNKNAAITFDDFSQHLKAGSQKLEVRFTESGKPIPFEIVVDYFSIIPKNNASACKLKLETKLPNTKVKQGESTRLSTVLTNMTEEVITSPIAIVGIPSGLSPQPWQLKALQEEQTIAHYEVTHNKVVFYLRELAVGEVKKIHLDLKADIPGKYQSPASNAYLYYENDVMAWVSPTMVEVLQ